jgi:hypothetical protein
VIKKEGIRRNTPPKREKHVGEREIEGRGRMEKKSRTANQMI